MSTLKISDLSVGDWAHHDFYEVDMRVVTIYGDTERIIAESSSGLGVTCHLDHFSPIPITAEILEKNGWRVIEKDVLGDEYEYDGEERVWDDGDCRIEICEEKQGVFWYSRGNEYYMWRLEHIHQLQHLIRLAGVDKEINL